MATAETSQPWAPILTVLEGGVTSWNHGSTVQQALAVSRGSVLVARKEPPAFFSTRTALHSFLARKRLAAFGAREILPW